MLAALLIVGVFARPRAQARFLSLSTGGPGGVYFPLGGAMADLLSRHMPGIVTAESLQRRWNARLVGNGLSDMGMVLGSVAYNAPPCRPLSSRWISWRSGSTRRRSIWSC